ncbi:SagB/ThcOx family dehydrogenase [Streptomyces sp. SID4946]|uniref:SagB/ThcOx family dehydrogenase n=1 Tax=Streptomyces sp. LamerLS-31b TaxID=1839765 RepID=UPI00081F61EB|nr:MULTISPECIES: SagB family peptide dehydrogenase [unclassified Streptomyces]MYQ94985.1 SagB/ThcOx family dehydrogenase [Streptomyces sp. SID4946]SCF92802.1 SagB-type dehydrogenase domain-containing protein [Streptomyces sp. DconLS]SCG03338.1 SagB-type dehydrogenase domain-containing protein [Streptomyces sp. LamerLS-31b]
MPSVQSPGSSAPVPWIELWSLREETLLEELPADAALVLRSRWGDLRIPRPGAVLAETLRRMLLGPVQLDNVPGVDELAARLRLLRALRELGGLVVRSVGAPDGEQPLLSVVPTAIGAWLDPVLVPDRRVLRLSRFATLRSSGRNLVLESPLSQFRAAFTRPETGWLIASLSRPVTLERVAERLPLAAPAVRALVAHLIATGMVEVAEEATAPHDAVFPEDQDPVLLPWSSDDLRFHWSSRPGGHDREFGATYPLRGRKEQPPALKELPTGPRIRLFRPDPGVPDWDTSLTEILDRRRSIRDHDSAGLTLRQVGEILYRSLRVRESTGPGAAREPASRPYPSGGARYELECYLTVGHCTGLEPGVYYYDPLGHALVLLPTRAQQAAMLLDEAQAGAGMTSRPALLLTLTARFARVSWKYSGLAYALTLKHVGVVQQTLYLLATGMGLAPCALGTGTTPLSAEAFGLDWREESAVGEFILGALPG